jgi:hypothetical protein
MASAMTVLPLPGGPKRKMDLPGVDGRAQLGEDLLADDQVRKGLAHRPLVDDICPSDC